MRFVDLEKSIQWSSEESCGMGNDKVMKSRSIGYSSDEPVQRRKDKSESLTTFT